jgi:hypothetical protein
LKTYKQQLTSNIHEAAVASYVGYKVRFSEADKAWVILDPGDLNDLWADARSGRQGIADAVGLLKVYDELLAQKTQPANDEHDWREYIKYDSGPTGTLRKEFYTRDMVAAGALIAVGYPVRTVEPPEGEWRYPRFIFEDDGNAMQIAKTVVNKVRTAKDNAMAFAKVERNNNNQ